MERAIPNLRDLPVVKAITLAHDQPEVGLPALIKLMPALKKEGRLEEAHAVADTVVAVACKARRSLGTAERIGRQLVEHQPDRYHLEFLAQVLELRGKKHEAAAMKKRAKGAEDQHVTQEFKKLIREAAEELGAEPPKL